MGIEARHAYRFGYLQSEHWQNLRLEKLASEDARCLYCGIRDLSNDVHHIYYPEDLHDAELGGLRVLCRAHHERVHEILPDVVKGLKESGDFKTAARIGFESHRIVSKRIEAEMRSAGHRCYTRDGGVKSVDWTKDFEAHARYSECKKTLNRLESMLSVIDSFPKETSLVFDSKRGAIKHAIESGMYEMRLKIEGYKTKLAAEFCIKITS